MPESRSPAVHRVAFWCVVLGIGIEALCTIFLFVFDEGISGKQQSKIIALELRLASRGIDDPAAMTKKLKPFSGTPFSICIQPGDETLSFLDQITPVLVDAGWIWKGTPQSGEILNSPGQPPMALIVLRNSVEIRLATSRVPQWGTAATTLADALKAEVVKSGVFALDDVPNTVIEINIGTK